MSSIAAELNSLSTATVIDFYRRWVRAEASDAHFLIVSKVGDGVLGGLRLHRRDVCRLVRLADRGREPLRLVLLRLDPRRLPAGDDPAARARWRVHRADRGHAAVAAVTFGVPSVSFLWHNVIGAVTVVVVGVALSMGPGKRVDA